MAGARIPNVSIHTFPIDFFHFETIRTANASTVNSESASDDTHLGAEQNWDEMLERDLRARDS